MVLSALIIRFMNPLTACNIKSVFRQDMLNGFVGVDYKIYESIDRL
jgi:hypothetical protein